LIQALAPKFKLSAFESVEREGIVETTGDRVRFSHPLLASTHYSRSSVTRRREIHRLLANVVEGEEERAYHLALGAEAPDQRGLKLSEGRTESCHKSASRSTYKAMHNHRGDRSKQAFEELYGRLGRRLLLHLARRIHDIDAATELWAECWAAAFAGWSRCKARSDGQLEAWIFGIARHQLVHYYRSGEIASRALDQLKWTVPTMPEREYAELERDAELAALRAVLREAVDRLPAMRHQAVELRVLEGLSYEHVAARLGCSEQAARAHVSRGLRQLERQLNREQILDLQGAT
jgi:RNA polymerase sigma factor (sigma-70 family)